MAVYTYHCSGCGEVFEGPSTVAFHDVCVCGVAGDRMFAVTAFGFDLSGCAPDYCPEDSEMRDMDMNNKAILSANIDKIKSGEWRVNDGKKVARELLPEFVKVLH